MYCINEAQFFEFLKKQKGLFFFLLLFLKGQISKQMGCSRYSTTILFIMDVSCSRVTNLTQVVRVGILIGTFKPRCYIHVFAHADVWSNKYSLGLSTCE